MKLWVGLGNPGAQYAGNRHNIGFMAVDRIAEDHGFGPWRARFQGEVSEGRIGSERIVLLKPATYMNDSGRSVRPTADFYKIPLGDITVFHDELDIAPGKCRLKQGGGHAGHNGLRSISQHMGEAYARVRLGVGHPGDKAKVANYVLGDFSKADREGWLADLLHGISDGAPALARGEGDHFLNAVSLRVAPPRSSAGTHPERAPAEPKSEPKAAKPAKPKAPAPTAEDTRSPLDKLRDKFNG
uniref:aminoacyl-tRNA hydrolase n=1 Tax=Paenirhodobacter enshiensis TaxID=1105367 RepID=UPI0035B2320A